MVFHCRCFSFLLEDETRTQTQTQTKSTTTLSFYTAASDFNPNPQGVLKPNNLRVFKEAQLKAATQNFCTPIGEGEFGRVYKGAVKSLDHPVHDIQVAVKRAHGSFQKDKEWEKEINVLGAVEHPNLVKLIGYCTKANERGIQRLLVYEYMVNGSVRDHLSAKSETPFSWTMRMKVAQDVARGLTYLHEETNFQVVGPVEYTAPEYHILGNLTSKSDVWSYGVFLYELITGRRPLDRSRPKNEQFLLKWVKPYLGTKRFRQIIDPRLEGNYPLKSAEKLCIIANKCLSDNPKSRPKMSEVLEMVSQLITIPSEATCPASPQAAVDPNTNEDTEHKGQKGSMKIQVKKPACLPHIRPLKLLKSCSKKACCASLH